MSQYLLLYIHTLIICIFVDTKLSARELMLNWIQATMPSWHITNFTSDWHDGRSLLSLIHEIKPDKVPPVGSLDPRKSISNCTLAIRTAKIYLKVPPIISPEMLVSGQIDELSMMTYLSYFVKPATKTVLKLVQEKIPQLKINNLTTDWNNGIAFGAFLNSIFPGTFPKWKSQPRDKPKQNLEKVFEAAKTNCGIEPTISSSDMADPNVEELHVITYILRIRYGSLVSLPEQIGISGPGIHEAKCGRQTHFLIDITRAGSGELAVDGVYSDSSSINVFLKKKSPGIMKVTYIPEKPGTLTFNVLWSDSPIAGSPFQVIVTDTSLIHILDRENMMTITHVDAVVQLKLNTSSLKKGVLTSRLIYSHHPPISTEVIHENGISTVEFVPKYVGSPVLKIFWNKEEVKSCAIQYTVLDSRKYHISKTPKNTVYHTFEPVEFIVESEDHLPLKSLQLTAICGDVHIPFLFENIVGDKGYATFSPTLPGVYSIEVACVDKLVEGSPFLVTAVDPTKCVLLTKVPKYLAIDIPCEIVVSMSEAGPGEVIFNCLSNPNAFVNEVTEIEPLRLLVKLIPKTLGEAMVTITHCGGDIPGCPFRIITCDPANCKLSGKIIRTKKCLVGSPLQCSISSPDWMDLKPVVKVQGPTARYPTTISKKSAEEFSVEFTPWEVGEHEITVTLGGFPIKMSPFHFVAVTGDFRVCSASGNGLSEALTGIPAQFIVFAKQPGLIKDGYLDIQVENVVDNGLSKVRARDNENGSYNVAYLTDKPGSYLVNIKAWGKHIPGSPFRVNVLKGPDAKQCKLLGHALKPLTVLKIGEPIEFRVDASDAGTGKLEVSAVGARGVQARVFMAQGDRPGIQDIQLDPIRSGKYRIGVKWSGQHVPGSPFLIRIFPGADASKCRAYGPGLENGVVGKLTTFTIETRNAGSGVLKVCLNGVKDAFKVEVKPVSSQDVRTLVANYNASQPGDYLITIKWSDKDITGSPFKVKIGGSAKSQNNEGIHLATPRNIPLGTIPEEYEDSESQTSVLDQLAQQRIMKAIPVHPFSNGIMNRHNKFRYASPLSELETVSNGHKKLNKRQSKIKGFRK